MEDKRAYGAPNGDFRRPKTVTPTNSRYTSPRYFSDIEGSKGLTPIFFDSGRTS